MPDRSRAALQNLADQAAAKHGIPPDLFAAMITQESGWQPRILGPVTKYGQAGGLGQLLPGTAAGLGVKDRFDPEANLDGSARYLKQQYERFGSWDLALAAYNAGPGAVQKAGNQIPRIRETQNYVAAIMGRVGKGGADGGEAPSVAASPAAPAPFVPAVAAAPQLSDGTRALIDQAQFGALGALGAPAPPPGGIQALIDQAQFGAPGGPAPPPGGIQALIDRAQFGG